MAESAPLDSPEVLVLIERGLPMVERIAKRIRRGLDSSYQLDDLIAAGRVGLVEAARRFDESYGRQFESFAYYRIQGEIFTEVGRFSNLKGTDYHRAVALEAAATSSGNDVCEAVLDLIGLQDTDKMNEAEIEQCLDGLIQGVTTATAVSLLRPAAETDVEDQSDLESEYHQRELGALALKMLDELDPEDAAIFRRKHLENLTFEDLSKDLGLARPWICRRYHRALQSLQKRMMRVDAVPPMGASPNR